MFGFGRKRETGDWVDLKSQPVPEGRHLLEVDDLKMFFHTQDGVVKAVNGVSYTLDRGETLGVVGESGSGKSVTSLTIMGLIDMPPGRIEGGDVLYRGRSLLAMSEEEMEHIRGNDIAMIFQDPMTSLNPVYTIGRQLSEGMMLHLGYNRQQALQRSVELLRMVGIPNAEQRVKGYPHELSGGMRQRVMIAMALACDPDILIADEPTTALDVTIQAQIIELMQEMQEKNGNAIIMITHDLGVVADIADKIMVMYAGQPVEFGTADEIFYSPIHPYTWGLTRSIPDPIMDEKKPLTPIKGNPPSLVSTALGCAFAPRCPYATDRCRGERPPTHVTGTGHYARCHFAHDAAFVAANAPATSRTKGRPERVAEAVTRHAEGGEAS
ncbi:MAG: ABC transporter ATP-binding protein [Acidobacteriota bacterium]|nr:ABC transporter ATP-binding protein [Acidobacteriota bacterium]